MFLHPPLPTSIFGCPSNLKEAIDWILRVTGKDGQESDNTAALARAAKTLLQKSVQEVDGLTGRAPLNDTELKKLKDELGKVEWVEKDAKISYNLGPICRLANGLADFIGYKNLNTSSYSGPDNWKITGAGIAPSNMATHRLCDATIAFTIGVLEKVKNTPSQSGRVYVNVQQNHKDKIDKILLKLHACYGKGPGGLSSVSQDIKATLSKATFDKPSGSGFGGFLDPMGQGFETLASAVKSSSDQAETVAEKVGEYLNSVLNGTSKWTNTSGVDTQLKGLLSKAKIQRQDNTYTPLQESGNYHGEISQLNTAIKTKVSNSNLKYLEPTLNAGKQAFIWQLQKRNYESRYKGVSIDNINASTHAKIFLGCLPLIFNNLSYFYWQCRENGAWHNQNLTGGPLSPFMEGHWFRNSYMNENMTGTTVVKNVMDDKFKEFKTAANKQKSYSGFLKKLRETGQQTWQTTQSPVTTSTCLSGIYILFSCYFQCQQIKVAERASRSPQTIREMLYFLAALQFSPNYDEFDSYVTTHFENITSSKSADDSALQLVVADSASDQKDNKLSAAALKEYIHSTCSFSPSVLGWLQGPGKADDPWIHRLFSNSEFSFRYPSGPGLFQTLSDYTYALQFQLSFLYKQCEYSYDNGCGWFYCKYGSEILPKTPGNAVNSHLCEGFKCEDISKCEHNGSGPNSTGCSHDEGGVGQKCGKDSNSPLQAFLTDSLPGFSRGHPSGHSAHLANCSGSLCHVPMGFKSDQLRTENKMGGHIVISLKPFCGSSTTPLRQLCGTLTCLSKRAPRSLGDLFGFYWQVSGQLFNKLKTQDGKPTLDTTLPTLLQKLSTVGENLLYDRLTDNVKVVGHHFFGLSWHCHKKSGWQTVERSSDGSYCTDHTSSKKACDLMSLYDSECTGENCGKYLEPLGISSGATFADKYAFTYLSWAVYLTDDLYESLQEFLDTFNGLKCAGCKSNCSSHSSGSHGSQSSCHCRSVVECSDVLPHLYASGFSFHNAYWLRGRDYNRRQWDDNSNKRSCANFHDQLQSVISGNPLSNLLTSIDAFLYAIRWEFFSKLSGFWNIYVCIILYTFFFLLDTLHLRSHLKFTASHMAPPLALLTSGKPLPITKLTFIAQ
ncbi:variant erythrocyte surface antigen-1 family protein [Babesia caballi]|uniref:Variant erythrocyte surface antigen-1 family protein n=1 Tax=Babesia caballi TaxID=5871 RepID=A0AAV4LTM8_BABCB|nr:variant erythrocyte surface antigen-1 family protein [Babesia caballi]